MNLASRMFIPGSRRAISTALRPCTRGQHLFPPQKTFVRGAAVVPGIFPIHKLPLLTFLRHQSVSPKSAEIEDAPPQIKPRYKIIYTCGVYDIYLAMLMIVVKSGQKRPLVNSRYHHGTVIIRCEGCRNLHLIADHLKIISEARVELEDILQGKVPVRRGVYLEDRGSVVEFGEPEAEAEIEELAAPETSKQEEK